MAMTRLSRKSQVTIPAELRRRAGIELGDEIVVNEEDGRIVISKAEPDAWLAGMEAFRGEHWNSAAEDVLRERAAWDQRH